MIFKGLKVVWVNGRRTFLEQKGSPRDPPGDQKGAKKDPRAEKVTFQKPSLSLSKTILFEARGGQKAPQRAPKGTAKIEEKTKTKKERKRGSHGPPTPIEGGMSCALWDPGSLGAASRALLIQ